MATVEWVVRVMGGLQRESAAGDVAGEGAAGVGVGGRFFAASVVPLVVEWASVTLVLVMVRVMYRWRCRWGGCCGWCRGWRSYRWCRW